MKKFFLFIGVIISLALQTSASKNDLYMTINAVDTIFIQKADKYDATYDSDNLPQTMRVKKLNSSEVKFKDVTLTQSGTLASVVGDEINNIDSLVVRGPINATDFYTMWSGSFYGRLTVINLEYSSIQNNKLPMNAFWYQSEQ